MLNQSLRLRYKILKFLGSGRFGETYLAEDLDLPGKPSCVVKRFRRESQHSSLQVEKAQFEQHAEISYLLGNHDQIPLLLAEFEEQQEFYLIQQFIDGNNLSAEITASSRWTEQQAREFLQDALKILQFVHQQNFIHQDIKPQNFIRRNQDGKFVLIGLSAAQQVDPTKINLERLGQENIAIGSPDYMPPEQAKGNPKFNSDIYAVGIVAIQAITGIFPLPKDSITGEINWRNHVDISSKLADVLDKMVRYNFRQRYQSATDALIAINNLSPPPSRQLFFKLIEGEYLILSGLLVGMLLSAIAIIKIPKLQQLFLTFATQNFSFPSPTATNQNLIIYQNFYNNIKISYPHNWQYQNIQNLFTGEVVKFLPPDATGLDPLPASVTVKNEDLSQNPLSLKEYTDSVISEIKQFLPNSQIIESMPTTLSNKPAHLIVYTNKNSNNVDSKILEIWTVANNQAYIITYSATPTQYQQFLETAKQIFNSFQIL
ncbi:MAG: PsbP-related protein [Crinalium sp.]